MHEKKRVLKEHLRIQRLVTGKFPGYYLTGGTSLALQLNHRLSEDLDFFSQKYQRSDPEKIMNFLKGKTGYNYRFLGEVNEPGKVKMKSFLLEVPKIGETKIDIVQDPFPNIKPIKEGLHSIEDVYFRKIAIAVQPGIARFDDTGREISIGRQATKDVFDLYYLSSRFRPLSQFFHEYFQAKHVEKLKSWYIRMDKMALKIGLKEEININHADKVIRHLDDQIIRQIS